jgi:hypothetical protein
VTGARNDLDAIEALSFDMLSGPEAGEQIRDSLIAEIRWLRAERDELRKALTFFGHDDRSLELFRKLRRASEDAPS